MKPKHQVVIVTRGKRGIGKAIAQRCAAESAKVALVARTESTLQDVADEIHGVGGKALVAPDDVSSQAPPAKRWQRSYRQNRSMRLRESGTSSHSPPLAIDCWLTRPGSVMSMAS